MRYLVMCLGLWLCGSQSAMPAPAKPETCEEMHRRLLPVVIADIEATVNDKLAFDVELEFVDNWDGIIPDEMDQRLKVATALRQGNKILIRRQPTPEAEAYDTLVHEIFHMVTNMPTSFPSGADRDVVRLMVCCNEAISWRFAAELTAKKYQHDVVYNWSHLPPSRYPVDAVVRMVLNNPAGCLLVARDYDFASDVMLRFDVAVVKLAKPCSDSR